MRLFKAKQGFTLIELLVVISIISILSAFLMANFIGVRQRGRDALRKSDLRQIQSALELYRADNGKYPGFDADSHAGWGIIYNSANPSGSVTVLSPNYMSQIPEDPTSTSGSCPAYLYTVDSNFSKYTIFAELENTNDHDATQAKPTPNLGSLSGTNTNNIKFKPGQAPCNSIDYNFWVINP